MSRAPLAPYAGAAALQKVRRIAADLVAVAFDPASDLPAADRLVLAALAMAVEVEAARTAGVTVTAAKIRARLVDALARVEASAS